MSHPQAAGVLLIFSTTIFLLSPSDALGRQPTTSIALPVPTLSSNSLSLGLQDFRDSIQHSTLRLQSALTSLASSVPTTPLGTSLKVATARFYSTFSSETTSASFTETIPSDGASRPRVEVLVACVPGEAGTWVLPGSGCTAFYRCGAGRQPLEIRNCPAGKVFFTQYPGCQTPVPTWSCWEPVCAGRVDGLYPDPTTGCRRAVRCQGSRVVAALGCPAGQLSVGPTCQPASQVSCPRLSESSAPVSAASTTLRFSAGHPACWGRSPSLALDRSASSRCRQYFRCSASGQRTLESCPVNQVFDGSRCVDSSRYECPANANANSPCDRVPDGVHILPGSNCRSYLRCSLGYKSVFVCPGDSLFDGKQCVPPGQAVCSESSSTISVVGATASTPTHQHVDPNLCAGKSHGYFADYFSGCRRYAYCLSGARVVTFTCEGGRRFDGTSCVEAGHCPGPASTALRPLPLLQSIQQGFFPDLQSGCHNYSFFIAGRETKLSCPPGLLFNGQLCVSESTFTCPTG